MPARQFAFVERRQLRIPARGQFGGLDQNPLQMRSALLGDRAALRLVRRADQRRGQPAVADCVGDGGEAADLADLQGPGQRGDVADAADRFEPVDTFAQRLIFA